MATNKEKVLFFVGRHLRAAEDKAKVDHEALAKARVGYGERAELERKASEAEAEREALQVAFDFLRDNFYNSFVTGGDRADSR